MSSMLYPMLLVMVILLTATLVEIYKSYRNQVLIIIAISLILFIIPIEHLKEQLSPGFFCKNVGAIFSRDAEIISQNTLENEKIYLVCQGDNGSAKWIIGYYIAPRKVSAHDYDLSLLLSNSETSRFSEEEIIEYISEFDYVFLSNVDDDFNERYGELFGNILDNQQLYKVNKKGESVSFERIMYQ